MKKNLIGALQLATIRAMRVDDAAIEMMASGVRLTWEQADALGDDVHDWMRTRLGLVSETDDRGVVYSVPS